MIHKNVAPVKKRPKAKLRAVGEIIRKNGERQEIILEGETELSREELEAKLNTEIKQEN